MGLFSRVSPEQIKVVADRQLDQKLKTIREDMRKELQAVGLWCKAIEKRLSDLEQRLIVVELESKLNNLSDRNKRSDFSHFKGNRVQL